MNSTLSNSRTAAIKRIKYIKFNLRAEKSALPVEIGETYHTPAQRAEMAAEAIKAQAAGNVWAWCDITVTAEVIEGTDRAGRDLQGIRRSAHAGGFSFKSIDDFQESPLFKEMQQEAFNDILNYSM